MIELLIGAGVGVAGYIAGQRLPRPHRRRVKPVKPTCGCEHHHDAGTGQCHGLMRGNPLRYDDDWDDGAALQSLRIAEVFDEASAELDR